MKIKYIIINLVLIISINLVYSIKIDYSDEVNEQFNNYDVIKENKVKDIKNKYKIKRSNTNFNDIKNSISSKRKNNQKLIIDENEKKLSWIIKETTKGVSRIYNKGKYKDISLNYIKTNLPSILTDAEELKVLYINEDYCGEQERDENGKIKDGFVQKTNSFTVKIGRTLFDMPILNSYIILEIDPENDEIISLDLKNWHSFDNISNDNLLKLSKEIVKSKINTRFNKIDTHPDAKLSNINIQHILLGWIYDKQNIIQPAFVHFSKVTSDNEKTRKINQFSYSHLEVIE